MGRVGRWWPRAGRVRRKETGGDVEEGAGVWERREGTREGGGVGEWTEGGREGEREGGCTEDSRVDIITFYLLP